MSSAAMGVKGHPRGETGVFLREDGPELTWLRGWAYSVCVCVYVYLGGQLQRGSWHIKCVYKM